MNTAGHVKPVDGQCGTCFFAIEFGFGTSPSGPEDGVHCNSYQQAVEMDQATRGDTTYTSELLDYGFMDIYRLEVLAEESYRCTSWLAKETEVKEQLLPAPDESPLTVCPWCGKEYNVKGEDVDQHYTTLVVATPGKNKICRHKDCGKLVEFTGGVD